MSLDQFKTFYWPTYKKVVLGLIDLGLTPVPFYEGIWDQRLEFLREFPPGKTIAHFAHLGAAEFHQAGDLRPRAPEVIH